MLKLGHFWRMLLVMLFNDTQYIYQTIGSYFLNFLIHLERFCKRLETFVIFSNRLLDLKVDVYFDLLNRDDLGSSFTGTHLNV